ncbi:MAG TPA: hypothetical protein VGR64_06465 [Terracidiphilus sp.]|nr:hypothetical protein [Terracidiphilus sp.]
MMEMTAPRGSEANAAANHTRMGDALRMKFGEGIESYAWAELGPWQTFCGKGRAMTLRFSDLLWCVSAECAADFDG